MSEQEQQQAPAQAPIAATPPAGEPYFLDPANPSAPTSFPTAPAPPAATAAAHQDMVEDDNYQVTTDQQVALDTQGARAQTGIAVTAQPTDQTQLGVGTRAVADSNDGLSLDATARARHGDEKNYAEGRGGVVVTPDGASGTGAGELQLSNEELRLKLGGGATGLGTPNPTGTAYGDAEYTIPNGPSFGIEGEAKGLGGPTPSGSGAVRTTIPIGPYTLQGTGGAAVNQDGEVAPTVDVRVGGPIIPDVLDGELQGGYAPGTGGTGGARVTTPLLPQVGVGVQTTGIGTPTPAVTPTIDIKTDF